VIDQMRDSLIDTYVFHSLAFRPGYANLSNISPTVTLKKLARARV
jgi:hypothetical protein